MKSFLWNIRKQEPAVSLILFSGMACAIYCMFRKWTVICLALIAVTTITVIIYAKIAQKQNMRRYGILYYQMSDGEIVEERLKDIYDELKKEKRCRLLGRPVSIRCVYRGVSPWDTIDTGYGITIVLEEEAQLKEVKQMHNGQIISFTGELGLDTELGMTLINITRIYRS